MGEAQSNSFWSPPLLRDDRATPAPGGDFGMLRLWQSPPREASYYDTRAPAGDLVRSAEQEIPVWLTEPE
jgi:hypothetical protein